MAITSSKMIQIGQMRRFLTSTENVISDKVITISKFTAKFFTSYRQAADILLDFFLSLIS